MARPRTISDEQIMDAARVVFVRDGIGATTAAVAREAGVSEGTVFKRFPTKDLLFQRAMGCAMDWDMGLDARLGRGEVRVQLVEVVIDMIEHLRTLVPRVVALSSHPRFSPHEFWRDNPSAAPLVALERLASYLGAEMAAGRLRRASPEVAARLLMGTTFNFAFFEHIGMQLGAPLGAEGFARNLVDMLWQGFAPEPREVSGR